MKKLISLVLVLVMVLSLSACSGKITLTDLLECPTSLDEAEAFLKKAGLGVELKTDQYVTFAYGNWDGMVSATCISLSLSQVTARVNQVNYEQEVADLSKQVTDLCGEPYSTHESGGLPGVNMESSTSFYLYDGGTIAIVTSTIAGTSQFQIAIYPGANS